MAISPRFISKISLSLLTLATVATPILAILPTPVQAEASKTATTVTQGSTTTVQIRLAAPAAVNQNVEVVFVMDASGSMSSQITTAKNEVKNFTDYVWDNGFASRTTITVVSFGYEGCADRSDDPHLKVHVNKQKLAARDGLDTQIDTVATTPSCSGVYYGFSDITAGIKYGNGYLTSGGSNNKFLVLISDGFQNMPAAGSNHNANGYRPGTWAGECPLYVNAGNDAMNTSISARWTSFMIVHAASADNSKNLLRNGAAGTLTLGTYNAPCHNWLEWYKNNKSIANITADQLLTRMQTAFPNGTGQTITNAVNQVKNSLVNTISLNDYLNTDVFTSNSSTISNIRVNSCNTSASSYGAAITANLNKSNNRIYGTIPYTTGVTYYCIRFDAVTKSNAPAGSQDINSSTNQPAICASATGSQNVIAYQNAAGTNLSCDTIGLGSITIRYPYTPPTPGTANVTSCTAATLNWTIPANSGIDKITLEYKTSAASTWTGLDKGMNTSHSLTGLSGSTTYNWRIIASYYGTNQTAVNGTNFTTPTCYTAPSGLTANATSCNTVELTWNVGTGTWFRVDVYDETNSTYVVWNQGVGSGAYSLTGLANAATTYSWTITSQSGGVWYTPGVAGSNFSTVNCYIPPTKTTLPSATCSGASVVGITLGWNQPANSGVNGYTLQYRTNGTSAWTSITLGTVTSYSLTGLSQNTTYNWQLVPKYYGVDQTPMTGDNFTTPYCLSYSITTPSSILIEPGGAGQSMTYNFTFTPNAVSAPTAWNGRQILFIITDIVPSAAACPAFNLSATPRTTGSHSSTNTIGVGFTGMNLSPSASQQQVIVVSAGDSTAQGNYKICYQARPNNTANMVGTYNIVGSNAFTVQYSRWLQIDKASGSISAGDVHSNGNLSFRPPYGKYLFNGVDTGLVSSVGANSIPANKLASVKEWRIPNYQSTIKTPTYAQLVNTITNNVGSTTIPSYTTTGIGGDLDRTLVNACTANQKAIIVQGNAQFNSPQNTTAAANCRLVYLISGNLTINQNIVMSHASSGVIYIVQGDILVDSTVTRLDGIYIFGGKFTNTQGSGSTNTTLAIYGSLIGLAGNNPSASTGSFLATTSPIKSGFGRDLGSSNNSPAETIIYQPKYLETFKALLGSSTITWTE